MGFESTKRCPFSVLGLSVCIALVGGCNSFLNSWFDPTQMGNFSYEGTTEIRTALSIQDTPDGIPGATDPQPEDLIPVYEAYRIGPGDALSIRIFELLARNTETATQASVDEIGTIAVPVLGQVRVAGMTRSEITEELIRLLAERGIIQHATIIVEVTLRRDQSYVVFGAIGGPNLYPLTRPNMRLLEALNTAGGLVDTATEVYVIRTEQRDEFSSGPGALRYWSGDRFLASAGLGGSSGSAYGFGGPAGETDEEPKPAADDEAELIDAVQPQPEDNLASKESVADQAELIEPAGQPRWIFVNGEWVPTTATEQPAVVDAPGSGESPPVFEQPTPLTPLPEVVPQVDWSRLAGDREQRVIRINAYALRDGDYRQNVVVRNGDTIRVIAGQTGEYYIMGQVNRPGAYTITGRQVTLKTAIASAGNLAPLAWPDRCTIYRRYGDREEMHQVNLDAIFAGKESDLLLKNNDLILVGTHPVAPFLAVFRNAFRLTYGFGFVYDRNFADIDSYGPNVNPSNVPSGFGSRFPNLFR